MIKEFKLYKWKKDTWVIYDETRDHGNSEDQDPWYPSFYRLLKSYRKGTVLSARLTDLSTDAEKSNKPDYMLSHPDRADITSAAVVYKKTSFDDKDYIVSTKELQDLFGNVPDTIGISIEE